MSKMSAKVERRQNLCPKLIDNDGQTCSLALLSYGDALTDNYSCAVPLNAEMNIWHPM